MTTWFGGADEVTHVLTAQESGLVYRAVDALATRYPDGPTRAALDRLLVKVANNTRDAADLEQERPSAIRMVGADNTPLSHSYRRSLLRVDIDDEDGEAA